MCPRSGRNRPTRCLRNTDLPVPDGPSSTEISPLGRVSETFSQMTWRPKDLLSPSTLISTPTHDRPPRRLLGQRLELPCVTPPSPCDRGHSGTGYPAVVPLGLPGCLGLTPKMDRTRFRRLACRR